MISYGIAIWFSSHPSLFYMYGFTRHRHVIYCTYSICLWSTAAISCPYNPRPQSVCLCLRSVTSSSTKSLSRTLNQPFLRRHALVPFLCQHFIRSPRASGCTHNTVESCPNTARILHYLLGWRALLAQGCVESSSGTKVYLGRHAMNVWLPIANDP